MFCHKCGTQIAGEAEFCHKCGAKVVYEDIEVKPQETNVLKENDTYEKPVDIQNSNKAEVTFPSENDNTKNVEPASIDKNPNEPKYKLPHNWSEFKGFFGSLPTYGKVLIIVAVCFELLIVGICIFLIIAILKMIFSSIIATTAVIAVGYFIYQRWGSVRIADFDYFRNNKLQLPEGMDSKTLLETLSGKFNYPYFKGVRYDEQGACVIEGKYAEYPVIYTEADAVKLGYNDTGKEEKKRLILREAIAIRSYLNKFFDPALPYDAMKDMKKLKFAEKQQKATGFVISAASVIICVTLVLHVAAPGIIKPGIGVRNAYLTEYSDKVTIEEAFDNFFSKGKWSTYKDESYTYVAFNGVCEYAGEPADVRITFKITGENFRVNSMDLNGIEQSDFILALMLEKIYEEY